MDEAGAALYGSVATAFLGLVGIIITQWVSLRLAKIRAKEEGENKTKGAAQQELPLEHDSLAVTQLRLDILNLRILVTEQHADLVGRISKSS